MTTQDKHHDHAHHNHHGGYESTDHEAHHDHDHGGHDHHGHASHDHGEHGHHHHGDFKQIFFRSLPIGIVIMLLSPIMGLTTEALIRFPYSDIVAALLATILLFVGGKPFFEGALQEFKDKEPSMMALVSMGLAVSYLYSVYAVFYNYTSSGHIMNFFFEFSSLILIMLLGHWIEMEALDQAGDAQQALAELLPKDAQIVTANDEIKNIPITELKLGDVVRIQAGENIPADGRIVRGNSRVNESLLTGESTPTEKVEGDQVIGGATNGEGILFVEVTQVGKDSFISQVQNLVGEAQSQPSRAEDMASRVASYLFWIALAAALISFIVWYFIADLQTAISYTVTTLVIACPHALGLAIPLVIARSTHLGAERGLLVKDREAYELTTKADVIVLDKTGTLTTGEFKVMDVNVLDDRLSKEEVLALLAGIEAGSSHPIAQSIVDYVHEQNIQEVEFSSIEIIVGQGIAGVYEGNEYQLISQKTYGQSIHVDVPTGATLSILTKDGKAIGTVALGDELKESSREFIELLKEKEIKPIMATGDNESAAKDVADELGIEYYSNQSPQDKYKRVENLKRDGKTVLMVGDGVNDAPSLALADVGIAIGAGTQVALDSADVILTQSEPGDIEDFIELAFKTNRKMNQNLVWGAGYNFIAIPIAAGLLSSFGITLSPATGAILMSLSTIIVAANAMLLNLDSK